MVGKNLRIFLKVYLLPISRMAVRKQLCRYSIFFPMLVFGSPQGLLHGSQGWSQRVLPWRRKPLRGMRFSGASRRKTSPWEFWWTLGQLVGRKTQSCWANFMAIDRHSYTNQIQQNDLVMNVYVGWWLMLDWQCYKQSHSTTIVGSDFLCHPRQAISVDPTRK